MSRRRSSRNFVVHNYHDVQHSRSSATRANENETQAEAHVRAPVATADSTCLQLHHTVHPQMENGVVQCRTCLICFTEIQGVESTHNRHHPSCSLFDRNKDCDPAILRFECILRWIKSLKVADLKIQLKLYYQKTSGKKVCETMVGVHCMYEIYKRERTHGRMSWCND